MAAGLVLLLAGCVTPQYAMRQAPVPDESFEALRIERSISALQAERFERRDARPIGPGHVGEGFAVQAIVDALSRVTERPNLPYHAYLYRDDDPNAAALADGRIYLSTGMLRYLAGRGRRADELASVIAHELAHTVAQHLLKRYATLQHQQLLLTAVTAGAAVATRRSGMDAQQLGRTVVDIAALLQDVALSGYSQEHELEADQLGMRYLLRAGFEPEAALELLEDFARFETPGLFLRTHPYAAQRRQHLVRYLTDIGRLGPGAAPAGSASPREIQSRIRLLREVQRGYPVGSISWQNLQRQIDALNRDRH